MSNLTDHMDHMGNENQLLEAPTACPSNENSIQGQKRYVTSCARLSTSCNDSPRSVSFHEYVDADSVPNTPRLTFTVSSMTMNSAHGRNLSHLPNLFHSTFVLSPSPEPPEFNPQSHSLMVFTNENIEEDVTEEFVKEFNRHKGNDSNYAKAERLILKMRRLGGLDPRVGNHRINIPEARMGLCFLTRVVDDEIKIKALDSLQELLRKDEIEKSNASQLITLFITLMSYMDTALIQTDVPEVQVKIAQTYSTITSLIQHHYKKKHLNGIDVKLKMKLISTAQALEALNCQRNIKVSYYVSCALEGIRRLKDNREELFDLIERFYHALAAVSHVFIQGDRFLDEVSATFKDLDPHREHAWYNGAIIVDDLSKKALKDPLMLEAIIELLREKRKQFKWKFTYAVMEALCSIVLHGETPEIRRRAFFGVKSLGDDYLGLASFISMNDLDSYTSWKPVKRRKLPEKIDPNPLIRKACAEHLMRIATESPDALVREKADSLLGAYRKLQTASGEELEKC